MAPICIIPKLLRLGIMSTKFLSPGEHPQWENPESVPHQLICADLQARRTADLLVSDWELGRIPNKISPDERENPLRPRAHARLRSASTPRWEGRSSSNGVDPSPPVVRRSRSPRRSLAGGARRRSRRPTTRPPPPPPLRRSPPPPPRLLRLPGTKPYPPPPLGFHKFLPFPPPNLELLGIFAESND